MQSIYEKDVELNVGGKLEVGQRYPFIVEDATYKVKVAVYNEGYPEGISGKEKKDLTPAQIEIVNSTPAQTWDTGREKPKFEDRLTLSILQPESGIKMYYGVEFRFPNDRPGKDFYDFVRATTGKDPEEGKLSLAKTIPRGAQFTAVVIKGKKGYYEIDKKQPILPLGMESEAPVSPATNNDSLSEPAKVILDHMISKKEFFNGANIGTAMMTAGKSLEGVLTKEQFMSGWREVKGKVANGNTVSL